MDERWLLSRRALLGGLGALGASALLPRRFARAQNNPAIPPRLIIVHVPEGMWNGAPRPSTGGTDLGQIFGALQPYQSKILVLNNLEMQSREHGPGGDGHHRGVPHMLTGTEMLDESNAGGPSVDQYIAKALSGNLPNESLQFAVRIIYGDTNSRPLWSAAGRVVPAMQDPWEAYDRVFSGVMPTSPTTPKPTVDLRRSALDYSLEQVGSLRARLPASDRVLLDSYHDSLRDIEMRLSALPTGGTGGCALPSLGGEVDIKSESNYQKIGELQMDLIVAALQCGLTRVTTLQWGNSNDQCSYSFLGLSNIGHDLAHNNSDCDPSGSKKLKVYQWYSEQFAYLLNKLESVPEAGGTMLDNTIVLWASEFGDSNGHSEKNLLWLLMGNAGGYFRSGRILNCGGRSTNDVHVSLCNAMGLDDTNFGNSDYCQGALPDLT